MQGNFAPCLAFTLKFEGGWSDHPRDPGGATMKGVTLATFSAYLGKRATKTELRNISNQQLGDIYRRRYWNAIDGDKKPAGVDLMLFDIAVNSGVARAYKFDDRCRHLPPAERIDALDRLRMGFYRHLPTWPVFGKGWSRRETACHALALKMAADALTA